MTTPDEPTTTNRATTTNRTTTTNATNRMATRTEQTPAEIPPRATSEGHSGTVATRPDASAVPMVATGSGPQPDPTTFARPSDEEPR